jgi:hypothetical protein
MMSGGTSTKVLAASAPTKPHHYFVPATSW